MILEELSTLKKELRALKKAICKEPGPRISKKAIRQKAEAIATVWFTDIASALSKDKLVASEVIEKYDVAFKKLLKLSSPNNQQDSYLDVLGWLLKGFRGDLVLPIQIAPRKEKEISALETILTGFVSTEEDNYFKEAAQCAKHDLLRASAVMGWCACIDRIHKTIEKIGYGKFNSTSHDMATQASGRFKRFNSPQNVTSISELREVFDSSILWILEGMQLIDNNQHTRLRSCFDLRCQSAHPGDAPVTEYNLMSFFSDINEIVFKNTKFAI
ncbi:MAG TPA: hypothetical protein VK578_07945 [Edaphobacter sp.]|nr:hypothetical protein [Edaphobacter sp.]